MNGAKMCLVTVKSVVLVMGVWPFAFSKSTGTQYNRLSTSCVRVSKWP